MKRLLLFIIAFSLLWCTPTFATINYYVDPHYSGGNGTSNGTITRPWSSITSTQWSTINDATVGLGADNVTVYFSACNVGCTVANSSTQLSINRTDTSTHVLTLDGASLYSNSASMPSSPWNTNATFATCTGYECAKNAVAMTGKKFTITDAYPLASNASVNNCIGNIVVQGFLVQATEGQTAAMFYIHDLTLQYNEFTRTATGTLGPTVYVGPGNNGPCNARSSNVGGPDNVTVQYNYIHAGWGESIYVGASTGDPSTTPCPGCESSEYTANGLMCGTNCNTGVNYLIAYNTIESGASWGGQGDGTDVKDGHANLTIRGNTYRTTLACTSCGNNSEVAAGDGSCPSNCVGTDGQGIVAESVSLIEDNYIETPWHNGVSLISSWKNTAGRGAATIRNNIIIDINQSYHEGHQNGIDIGEGTNAGTCSGGWPCWSSATLYNNTIFTTAGSCIAMDNGSVIQSNNVTAENNICHTTSGIGSNVATVNHNDCYMGSTGCGGTGGITANPNFVSATAGSDTNFKVQSGSPALLAGVNLSSSFTTDYGGNSRPGGATAWTMGAWQPASGKSQSFTQQPTNVITGDAFSPQIQITLTSTTADAITLSITTGTCSLTGTTTVTSTGGSTNTATFSLSGNATGTGCVLTSHDGTDGTVADITCNSFNVSAITPKNAGARLRR